MASSERRKKQRAEKRARKASAMGRPGGASVYALKRKGIYPPNGPYRTIWQEFA